MSWFSSLFSSKAADQAQPATPTPEKRLLEEPAPQKSDTITLSKAEFEALRAGRAVQPTPSSTSPPATQVADEPNRNRNKIIFGAGLAFFAFSLLITRRAFLRRKTASNPAFYTNAPGHHEQQAKSVSGAFEAVEALNIATTNVLSLAMMATGGTLWYLDINSMAEARRFIRGGMGVDGTGRSEEQAEQEFEEWLATTLAKKESRILKELETRKKS